MRWVVFELFDLRYIGSESLANSNGFRIDFLLKSLIILNEKKNVVGETKFDDVYFKIFSGSILADLAGDFYTCVV